MIISMKQAKEYDNRQEAIKQMTLFQTELSLIYLANCSLHAKQPGITFISKLDLQAVKQCGEKHKMSAIAAFALLSLPDAATVLEKDSFQDWDEIKNINIRRNMLFDTEREEIFRFFELNNIWYMPLKGIIIQSFYPQYGMREMADNDILVDPLKVETIRQFMLERGYKIHSGKRSPNDAYDKKPIYNFEIHHHLFQDISQERFYDYYEKIKDRLINKRGSFAYYFTDEDFYIYFLAHAYKHINGGGMGLRTIMDMYVIQQKMGSTLDHSYVEQELKKLDMVEFEKNLRGLAEKLFAEKALEVYPETGELHTYEELGFTDAEYKLFAYMCDSGAYGTMKNRIAKRIENVGKGANSTAGWKAVYLLRRAFPSREWMGRFYPYVKKFPVLLPGAYIYRLINHGIRKRKKLARELKVLKEQK